MRVFEVPWDRQVYVHLLLPPPPSIEEEKTTLTLDTCTTYLLDVTDNYREGYCACGETKVVSHRS